MLGVATEPAAAAAANCPALRSLLFRASSRTCGADLTQRLCARFQLHEDDADLPLGALVHASVAGSPGDDVHALLAPIHLRVDRDRAYVVPLAREDVSAAEAAQLQALFEEQLGPLGYRFACRTPTLWSVILPGRPALRTHSLERATARDAYDCFPRGADARSWATRCNELQMLLHAHPLNERREQCGQLTINSVWLWGVGALRGALTSPFTAIYGDGGVIEGLAAVTDTPCTAPARFSSMRELGEGDVCVVLDHRFDAPLANAWRDAVETLETTWFAPLARALRRGEVRRLDLWPDNGRVYRVTSRQARRWRLREAPDLREYIVKP